MGVPNRRMVLNAAYWATRAGCVLFTVGLAAGLFQLFDFRDLHTSQVDQYTAVLRDWETGNRKEFQLGAKSGVVSVAAHLYSELGEQHADMAPAVVALKEDASSVLTEFPDDFGDLNPLSFRGVAELPTDQKWEGTVTVVVNDVAVDIPRVWKLPIKGAGSGNMGDAPDREMQYTLESICLRVGTRATEDDAAEWYLDAEQPESFERPLSPAQEIISDPMPVGCSERNLELRGHAGENTQRLRLWSGGVYKQQLQLMAHDVNYPQQIPVTIMSVNDPQISAQTVTNGRLVFSQTLIERRLEALIVLLVVFVLCGWAPLIMSTHDKNAPTGEGFDVDYDRTSDYTQSPR